MQRLMSAAYYPKEPHYKTSKLQQKNFGYKWIHIYNLFSTNKTVLFAPRMF
jgi:hypothetical protein